MPLPEKTLREGPWAWQTVRALAATREWAESVLGEVYHA